MWHDMASAPTDGTVIRLRLENDSELDATYEGGFLNEDGDDCGCWVAFSDDFPEDWTDGVCWASNVDMVCSTWPVMWRDV